MNVSFMLLGLAMLKGLVFLPVLSKHVKGPRSILMVLQQICIILYLSVMIIYMIFVLDPKAKVLDFAKFTFPHSEDNVFSFGICYLLDFWKYFFYFQYYLFCLMQTIDLHCMICHPFGYETFSKTSNLVRLGLVGSAVSLLLSFESLILMFFVSYSNKLPLSVVAKFSRHIVKIHIFTALKFGVAKLIYTLFAGKLAWEIKGKLAEISGLSMNQERNNMHQALYRFNLIPLLVNILLLSHDIPMFIFLFINGDCSQRSLEPIFIIVSAVTFTFTSFSYSIGYIPLFPKIRSAFKWGKCCAEDDTGDNNDTVN